MTSYNRMRYRTSPELTAGASVRSDPQAWAWRLQAGASLPFGIRNHLAFMALHDISGDWRANQVVGANVFDKNGSITTLASQLFLGYWGEGYLLAGLDGRFSTASGVTADGQTLLGTNRSIDIGGHGELDVTPLRFMRVNVHIDINEQWYEAPIAVHEGGTMTGAISHVYLYPKTRWVLFDGGASVRQLSLRPRRRGSRSRRADQLLAWAGLDFNLWTSYTRIVKQRSHGRTAGAARVHERRAGASYRNYQLFTESQPDFRISLAPRASINNGSVIFRKVLFGGRAGLDLHGGGGWDNYRHHTLAQAGGGITVATGWRTRVLATYDLAYETATGLSGTLHIGWLTFHVDL